jgi:hypothetical protein
LQLGLEIAAYLLQASECLAGLLGYGDKLFGPENNQAQQSEKKYLR